MRGSGGVKGVGSGGDGVVRRSGGLGLRGVVRRSVRRDEGSGEQWGMV